MLCAGVKGTKLGGCYGDNGGPFVCRNSAGGPWVLHGAVSWGSRSCNATVKYTVFARVSAFREWIEKLHWIVNLLQMACVFSSESLDQKSATAMIKGSL